MEAVIELLKREIERYESNLDNLTPNDKFMLNIYKRDLIMLEAVDFSYLDIFGTISYMEEKYKGKKYIPLDEEDYKEYSKALSFYHTVKNIMIDIEEESLEEE